MPYTIQSFPILERFLANGGVLDPNALKWMDRWRGLNLEDSQRYRFPELSGSTSVNLKIETTEQPPKSRGTFVTVNSATSPNTEIAYFHLLAIIGHSALCRPAARYELGPTASARFRSLMQTTPIQNAQRRANRDRILQAIAAGPPLFGAVKAKKPDSVVALDPIANTQAPHNGAPAQNHPVIRAVQASNPRPAVGSSFNLGNGYVGDALELAREYSILMTMDSLFEQWDRYSGGNVTLAKDDAGRAHFYATDNGGALLSSSGTWLGRNLAWFSRYDRPTLARLAELQAFLAGSGGPYLGYTDPLVFVTDLGLYHDVSASTQVARLTRNLARLATRSGQMEAQWGAAAFFD